MNLKVVNMPNEDSQGQSATTPGGPQTDPGATRDAQA